MLVPLTCKSRTPEENSKLSFVEAHLSIHDSEAKRSVKRNHKEGITPPRQSRRRLLVLFFRCGECGDYECEEALLAVKYIRLSCLPLLFAGR